MEQAEQAKAGGNAPDRPTSARSGMARELLDHAMSKRCLIMVAGAATGSIVTTGLLLVTLSSGSQGSWGAKQNSISL
jgi:hypothetical protein